MNAPAMLPPPALALKFGNSPETLPVRDIGDACRRWIKMRDEGPICESAHAPMTVIDATGRVVVRIAYDGRALAPGRPVEVAPAPRPQFGEGWRVRKGRTIAPAPEFAFAAVNLTLAGETQEAAPAKAAPVAVAFTPDLFTL